MRKVEVIDVWRGVGMRKVEVFEACMGAGICSSKVSVGCAYKVHARTVSTQLQLTLKQNTGIYIQVQTI